MHSRYPQIRRRVRRVLVATQSVWAASVLRPCRRHQRARHHHDLQGPEGLIYPAGAGLRFIQHRHHPPSLHDGVGRVRVRRPPGADHAAAPVARHRQSGGDLVRPAVRHLDLPFAQTAGNHPRPAILQIRQGVRQLQVRRVVVLRHFVNRREAVAVHGPRLNLDNLQLARRIFGIVVPPQHIARHHALLHRRRGQAAVVRQPRQRGRQHGPRGLACRAGAVRMLGDAGVQCAIQQPKHHVIDSCLDVDLLVQHRRRRHPAGLQASRRSPAQQIRGHLHHIAAPYGQPLRPHLPGDPPPVILLPRRD